jgi:hypothetical protein
MHAPSDAVVGPPTEAHSRMKVAGHRVGSTHLLRVMAERRCVHAPWFDLAMDAQPGGRRTGGLIMIALDEHKFQRGMALTPRKECLKRRRRMSLAGVKQVTEEYDRPRRNCLYQPVEPGQVIRRSALRHRDSTRTECRRLSEVRVGNHEPAPPLQESGPLCEQRPDLFAQRKRQMRRAALRLHCHAGLTAASRCNRAPATAQ